MLNAMFSHTPFLLYTVNSIAKDTSIKRNVLCVSAVLSALVELRVTLRRLHSIAWP